MKKFSINTATWYALLGLLIAVALLPILKGTAPQYFPTIAGFRDLDCHGVTCNEGQFCGENKKCINIATRYPNAVPAGNE